MKILTIVGARPQFIKAAPLSREIRKYHKELILHTGQHYDDNMSAVFFRDLDIPQPDFYLSAGGGSHSEQTAKMLAGIEPILNTEKPDILLVYGDTNSTLAGSLTAAKLHIPIAHVEAGLRSFNRQMPEEINRVLTDHLSSLLLCPSALAANNLANEGITKGVHVVGDVMADALFAAATRAEGSKILERYKLKSQGYFLATVHRAENTNDLERLSAILGAFADIARPILFPIHPRTFKAITNAGLSIPTNVMVCEPLGYIDLVRALRDAAIVLTDSGGLQKEAYWLSVPCFTLRQETEWVETVECGWNLLVGTNRESIINGIINFKRPSAHPILYGGDGSAAKRICEIFGFSDSNLPLRNNG